MRTALNPKTRPIHSHAPTVQRDSGPSLYQSTLSGAIGAGILGAAAFGVSGALAGMVLAGLAGYIAHRRLQPGN